MLNRRLLRVKVMQSLYGLKQAEKSDYFLSLDHIADIFAPDLNSMEPQNPEELRKKKTEASELFRKTFTDEKPDLFQHEEPVRKAVKDALELFQKRFDKDKKHYKQLMLDEVDRIYDNYILSLRLLIDLINYSEEDEQNAKGRYVKADSEFPPATNLRNNKLYKLLAEDNELEVLRIKKGLKWENEVVRKVYKNNLKKDDEILAYLIHQTPDFEEDRKILLYTAKNIIFKNETILGFFEENDYSWSENKSIVRSLLVKTLKSSQQDTDKFLIDISGNWEEDKEFFVELYQNTLEKDPELQQYIADKAKNWEMERIAMTDNIILKMALTEMIIFPSIPVKVSINEYIELSKTYSTPKSKQFVNGMLDSLSQELSNKGIIRKSGRGLIDNK